jgi:hypothetical protein
VLAHTWSARAEARDSFEAEYRLRSVNEDLPVNRPPPDLLRGKLLDEHHGAAAARAAPSCGQLFLVVAMRLGTGLRTYRQQLLAEGQKLFPAPVR